MGASLGLFAFFLAFGAVPLLLAPSMLALSALRPLTLAVASEPAATESLRLLEPREPLPLLPALALVLVPLVPAAALAADLGRPPVALACGAAAADAAEPSAAAVRRLALPGALPGVPALALLLLDGSVPAAGRADGLTSAFLSVFCRLLGFAPLQGRTEAGSGVWRAGDRSTKASDGSAAAASSLCALLVWRMDSPVTITRVEGVMRYTERVDAAGSTSVMMQWERCEKCTAQPSCTSRCCSLSATTPGSTRPGQA